MPCNRDVRLWTDLGIEYVAGRKFGTICGLCQCHTQYLAAFGVSWSGFKILLWRLRMASCPCIGLTHLYVQAFFTCSQCHKI